MQQEGHSGAFWAAVGAGLFLGLVTVAVWRYQQQKPLEAAPAEPLATSSAPAVPQKALTPAQEEAAQIAKEEPAVDYVKQLGAGVPAETREAFAQVIDQLQELRTSKTSGPLAEKILAHLVTPDGRAFATKALSAPPDDGEEPVSEVYDRLTQDPAMKETWLALMTAMANERNGR